MPLHSNILAIAPLNKRNRMKKSFLRFLFFNVFWVPFFTYSILQVQEIPSEIGRQGSCYGPVLRINCSQVVNFLKPVTIYLPVSLRGEPTGIPDTSKCHVRVMFRNCNDRIKNGRKSPAIFATLHRLMGNWFRSWLTASPGMGSSFFSLSIAPNSPLSTCKVINYKEFKFIQRNK